MNTGVQHTYSRISFCLSFSRLVLRVPSSQLDAGSEGMDDDQEDDDEEPLDAEIRLIPGESAQGEGLLHDHNAQCTLFEEK